MFPQLYDPSSLCSPQHYIPMALYSPCSTFPHPSVPTALRLFVPIAMYFPLLSVFTVSFAPTTLQPHSSMSQQLYVLRAVLLRTAPWAEAPVGTITCSVQISPLTDRVVRRTGDDSAEMLFQFFFFFAGGHREQFWHGQGGPSLMLSVQHFLCRTKGRSPSKVS